ncbi:SAM-dependent methyltransferase [Microbacterium sp. LWH12-1.2]|uniref:SAM-dependent methyltransferase n=1 Tax=Microbacterium sp. LWH12-1.2 TaxID=3135259 RepID=UPI00342DB6A6
MAREQATSFGAEALKYEVGRPDYPFEAVAWMLEPMPDGSRRIADVGAGTGKLTRVLAKASDVEIGRVVRSGGVLGLIWNIRDEREEWVRRLTEIMHSSPAENMVNGPDGPRVAEPFGEVESRRWEWNRPMSRMELHHMAFSRSYLITASDEERAQIKREMDEFFDELGLGDGTIDMPYVTTAFRALRG